MFSLTELNLAHELLPLERGYCPSFEVVRIVTPDRSLEITFATTRPLHSSLYPLWVRLVLVNFRVREIARGWDVSIFELVAWQEKWGLFRV